MSDIAGLIIVLILAAVLAFIIFNMGIIYLTTFRQ